MTTHILTRVDLRPAKPGVGSGSYLSAPLASSHHELRTYLPVGYERNYAYPLVVFFHPDGSNEHAALELAPKLSDRNLISISLRAPRTLGLLNDRMPACTWDGVSTDEIQDSVLRAIAQTRSQFNIHTERVYFAGLGDGARTAYRVGFQLSDQIAGIASLNGPFPTAEMNRPLFRLPQARKLKVLIGHGIQNQHCPISQADRAFRLMYAAGTNVRFLKYSTNRTISDDMLRDVNRWIIGNLNVDNDQLILAR
jgi:phospholipase/carboxylesterase